MVQNSGIKNLYRGKVNGKAKQHVRKDIIWTLKEQPALCATPPDIAVGVTERKV